MSNIARHTLAKLYNKIVKEDPDNRSALQMILDQLAAERVYINEEVKVSLDECRLMTRDTVGTTIYEGKKAVISIPDWQLQKMVDFKKQYPTGFINKPDPDGCVVLDHLPPKTGSSEYF